MVNEIEQQMDSSVDLLRKSSWLLDETLKNMDVLGEFSLFRSKSNISICIVTLVTFHDQWYDINRTRMSTDQSKLMTQAVMVNEDLCVSFAQTAYRDRSG